MLDEDEFEAEQSLLSRWSTPKAKTKTYDDDNDEPGFRAPAAAPKQKQLKRTFLLEEDDDDAEPAPTKGFGVKAMQLSAGPIAAGTKPVPFHVQEAAATVLAFAGKDSHALSQRSRDELTMHFLHHPHELYCVDPPIVCWASVETGTIRIYCKEVIPVSLYLMALAFGAQFQLQITPKVKTPPQPWEEAIQIKSCKNADATEFATRIAPLGTMAAVQAALQRRDGLPDNLDQRVQNYMARLGKLDTREVCDPDWIAENVEELRKACLDRNAQDANDGLQAKLAKMKK